MKKILVALALTLSVSVFAQEPNIKDSLQNLNTNFHFQLTTVSQHKFAVHSPYAGDNSLTEDSEHASTLTATIFWGLKLWRNAAIYLNPEIAGGSGLSGAHGIAGFSNGEAFRVGDPAPSIYMARTFFQQTISLSNDIGDVGTGANDVYKTKSKKYIDLIVGKFSVADYFDKNDYSHDPRSQFLNWSLMSNGAWDYPANVRGYTWGFVVEYGSPKYSIRAGSTMVAKSANGNIMDAHIGKANSSMVEVDRNFMIGQRLGKIRLLGFHTETHMGNYEEAIVEKPQNPDITTTRKFGRHKAGFGINVQQELGDGIGFFARTSWNDGKNETWAFTEIDKSLSLGILVDGSRWKRENDSFGLATVINGLSTPHKNYLAAGGYGFIIGDSQLDYGNELGTEIFYRGNLFSDTFYVTPHFHYVVNPAYNKDRGPAMIVGLRVHVEF